jgi:L,D-transpeptidase catalytic domain
MASRGKGPLPIRTMLLAAAGLGAALLAIFVLPSWWRGGSELEAQAIPTSDRGAVETPKATTAQGPIPSNGQAVIDALPSGVSMPAPEPVPTASIPSTMSPPPQMTSGSAPAQPEREPEPVSIVQSRRTSAQPASKGPGESATAQSPETTLTTPPSTTPIVQAALPGELEALPAELHGLAREGYAAKQKGELVAARKLLSEVLLDTRVEGQAAQTLRQTITTINDEVIFSPRVFPGDPYAQLHTFQASDKALSTLPGKKGLAIDWRLIPRVNRMSNPDRVSIGQKLKLITGPFHARVHKDAFRMDVFMGQPEQPGEWVFVRSFTVGLGEGNSTPLGEFTVRRNSKLVNPYWVNPRTGEKFEPDDPKNPIGERWIGLEGQGDAAAYSGYGIHGTIDPGSIGQMKSMGCVRLGQADVELIYELLVEGASRVSIGP